jgi:hypothetical protein
VHVCVGTTNGQFGAPSSELVSSFYGALIESFGATNRATCARIGGPYVLGFIRNEKLSPSRFVPYGLSTSINIFDIVHNTLFST